MPTLAQQRCLNHPDREAVARCPECGRFFCRECITEHADRVICAGCLNRLARAPESSSRQARFPGVLAVGRFLAGLLIAWFCFYLLGRALVLLPPAFHEGTVWKADWMQEAP